MYKVSFKRGLGVFVLLLPILVSCLPTLAWAASELKFSSLVDLPLIAEDTANIGDYINGLYLLSISAASLLVVVKIIGAGAGYVMSDVVTSKEQAKKDIRNALLGLLIILAAVTILNEINPNLKQLNFLSGVDPLHITGLSQTPTPKEDRKCLDDPTQFGCDIEKLRKDCESDDGHLTRRPGTSSYYCDKGKVPPVTNRDWEVTDSKIKEFFDKFCKNQSCQVLFVGESNSKRKEQEDYCYITKGGELESGTYTADGVNYNYCVVPSTDNSSNNVAGPNDYDLKGTYTIYDPAIQSAGIEAGANDGKEVTILERGNSNLLKVKLSDGSITFTGCSTLRPTPPGC